MDDRLDTRIPTRRLGHRWSTDEMPRETRSAYNARRRYRRIVSCRIVASFVQRKRISESNNGHRIFFSSVFIATPTAGR